MADRSLLQSAANSIRVDASNTMTLGDVYATAGNVSLLALGGSILNGNSASVVNVQAQGLRMTAANGIGLSSKEVLTTVTTLTANAGAGGMFVLESDGLTVGNVTVSVNRVGSDANTTLVTDALQSALMTSSNGAIVLQSTLGNITLNSGVSSNTTAVSVNGSGNVLVQALAGNVTLNANLLSGNGNVSLLAGQDVTLSSSAVSVSTGSGSVDVQAGNGFANATGNVTMAGSSLLQSTGGSIRVDASNNMTLGNISANAGNVSLLALGGSILNGNSAAQVNVQAQGLRMDAGTGIGQSNKALRTTVTTLSANAGAGGMFVLESDGLTVGNVTVSVNRVGSDANTTLVTDALQSALMTSSNGAIVLQTSAGNITLNNGSSSATTAISANGAGNVLVQALAGSVLANASVLSGDGNISVLAAQDVTLSSSAVQVATGNGSVDVQAGNGSVNATGNVTMAGSSLLQSTGGSIRVDASNTMTLGDVYASAGNVSLLALGGSIFNGNSASVVNVQAQGLRMTAANGIGQSNNALLTTVTTLTANAGAGGMFVLESDGLTVGNVTVSVNRVGSDATTTLASDAAQSDLVSTGNGAIVVQTSSGSITLNDGTAPSDSVAVNASGNVLLQTLGGSASDIVLNANVLSANGNVSILSGNSILLGTGASAATVQTGAGSIDLLAGNGNITMGAGSELLSSAGGNIRAVASANVTVGLIETSATVGLSASTGSILDGLASGGLNVQAGALRLNAGTGIGLGSDALEVQVATVSAAAGSGGIYLLGTAAIAVGDVGLSVSRVLSNASTLTVTDATQSDLVSGVNGNIVLQTSAGSITLNDGSAPANARAISAGTGGNVLVETLSNSGNININANVVLAGAGNLSIMSAGNVLLGSVTGAASLLSGSGTMDVDATGGNVTMAAGSLLSGTGNVRVLASNGVALTQIVSAGNVALTAGAGGIASVGSAATNVQASGLRLNASGGVGQSSNALKTQVNTLSASAGGAGVFLRNSQGVSVGDVAVQVNQVRANGSSSVVTDAAQSALMTSNNGAIMLQSTLGDIVLNSGSSSASTAISANGSGNVLVQALAGNVTLNANAVSGNGNLSLLAVQDLTLSSSAVQLVTGNGTLDLQAGNVTMAGSSLLQSTGGSIRVDASNTMTLGNISASAGNVSLLALGGSILNGNSASVLNVQAQGLRMTAANAIGQSSNALLTTVATLSANAGAGGIYLLESDGLSVGNVSASVNRVGSDASTTPVADAVQSGLVTAANGNIVLQSTQGDITLNGGASNASTSVLAGGSGNVLIQTLSASGNINVLSNVQGTTGNVTILAGNNAVLYTVASGAASVFTGGSGVVDVLATHGTVITGGTGQAGQNVNLVANNVSLAVPIAGTGSNLNIAPTTVPSSPDPVVVGGAPVNGALYLSQTQVGMIEGGFANVVIGSSMAGQAVTLLGQDASGNPSTTTFVDPLTLLATGSAAVVNISGGLQASSLLVSGSGAGTTLSAATVTVNGNAQINDNVIVSGNSVVSAGSGGSGNLTISGNISGAASGSNGITLNADAGNVLVQGTVSNLQQLTVNQAQNVTFSSAVNISGNVVLNATGVVNFSSLTISAGGSLTINGAAQVVIAGHANLSQAGNTTISANAISFTGGAGSITGNSSSALTLQGTSVSSNIYVGDAAVQGVLRITSTDLNAIAPGFGQVVIGAKDAVTGHASASDGTVEFAASLNATAPATLLSAYGKTITVDAGGTGLVVSGAVHMDAYGALQIGSSIDAVNSANVTLQSGTGSVTMGAAAQIHSDGGNVSVSSAGGANGIQVALIDARNVGAGSMGQIILNAGTGTVSSILATPGTNVIGNSLSMTGFGPAAGSAGVQNELQVRAPVVEVLSSNGAVMRDQGADGTVAFNMLSGGVLYQEVVVSGGTTQVTTDPGTILAGGASAMVTAGIPQSLYSASLLRAANAIILEASAPGQVLPVDTTASSDEQAAMLEQAYLLGSASMQPVAAGLGNYGSGAVDYWTETLSV